MSKINNLLKPIILLFSFALFFTSFQFNGFSAAEQTWFEAHQYDSEALVIARLVKSREDGIGSEAGRLGYYLELDGQRDENQSKLYVKELSGGAFEPYASQLGWQGVFFSVVDSVLNPFDLIVLSNRVGFYHAISSALLAGVLAVIVLLFYLEIGFFPSVAVILSVLMSQWLVVFGKNLYWVMGLMFLPMLVSWVFLKREEQAHAFNTALAFSVILLAVLIKASTGYEYLSTILIAMVSPIVYFAIKNKWPVAKIIKRFFIFGLAGLMGVVVAFAMHIYQSSVSNNTSYQQALTKQYEYALSRTHTDKDTYLEREVQWKKGINASVKTVILMYWYGKAFNIQNILGTEQPYYIHFNYLIFAFALFTIIGFVSVFLSKNGKANRQVIMALIVATWFSMAAPLSWYVLAKIHSFVHDHMNHVLWHMPFTLFGFALVGFVGWLLVKDLLGLRVKSGINP